MATLGVSGNTFSANYFKAIDANGDGFISAEEARATENHQLISKFDQLDSQNKDGKLSLSEFSQEDWAAYSTKLKNLIDKVDKQKERARHSFWFGDIFAYAKLKKLEKELRNFLGGVSGNVLQKARNIYSRMNFSTTLAKIDSSVLKRVNFKNVSSLTWYAFIYFPLAYRYIKQEDFAKILKNAQKTGQPALTDEEIKQLYNFYAGADGKMDKNDWQNFLASFN